MSRSIQNTRVAVVGGAGFLGSHLVNHLVFDRECEVVVLDNLVIGKKAWIPATAKFIHCDITKSESFMKNVFTSYGIQYVFNYAAYPYIPDSFERPLHVFEVNATGAIQVINAAQEAGCKGILQVSSAEIYGDGLGIGFELGDKSGTAYRIGKINESVLVRPHSTYGVAKAAVDYYCQSAWKERRTPVISLRQFNCVGERESHPYVIPEIIRQLDEQVAEGIAEVYLGNNSFRDFQYAGDAASMAVELLEVGQFGEVYNMGSESGIKIYDLAKLIGKLMDFEDVRIVEDPARVRPWEIWHLQSDNSKLYSTIKSRPLVSFEEALKRTIDDYRLHGWSW